MANTLNLHECIEHAKSAAMSENTFAIESVCQIDALVKSLGGLAECKRLGFIFEDGQGVMSLSVAGLGYLLYVKARGVTSLAEAFAEGYQCAHDEIKNRG